MSTLRYPDGSPDCAHNHFGWRFEGPGLQPVAYEPHNDEPLLPVESFRDPRLQIRPPFLNDQIRQTHFRFFIGKQCAGLRHELRMDPGELYQQIVEDRLGEKAITPVRWALSGMRFPREFPMLHCIAGLTIEELARLSRHAGPPGREIQRAWLNQWAHDPSRPMPSATERAIGLNQLDELDDIDLATIPMSDPRRYEEPQEDGTTITCFKLNGILYYLRPGACPKVE